METPGHHPHLLDDIFALRQQSAALRFDLAGKGWLTIEEAAFYYGVSVAQLNAKPPEYSLDPRKFMRKKLYEKAALYRAISYVEEGTPRKLLVAARPPTSRRRHTPAHSCCRSAPVHLGRADVDPARPSRYRCRRDGTGSPPTRRCTGSRSAGHRCGSPSASSIGSRQGAPWSAGYCSASQALRRCWRCAHAAAERRRGALVAPSCVKGQFSMCPRGSGNLSNHPSVQLAKTL